MAADYMIKAGDTSPIFKDDLTLGGGADAPFQGATVAVLMRSLTSGSVLALTGAATFTNVNGAVQYSPAATDLTTPGNYIMSWFVTFANGSTMTWPTDGYLWVEVQPTVVNAPVLIVDLPTVKAHLSISSVDRVRDAKLMRIIGYITPLIEMEIGPVVPRVFEEWHDGGTDMVELLRQPSSGFGTDPVLQLVGVSEYSGNNEYPLSIVPSPALASIYSVFLNADMGTITRRSAGGDAVAFAPGRETVHVLYNAGQKTTPPNVQFAALECVRVAYEWTQQTGVGSRSFADEQEVGPSLQFQLSRMIRTMLGPTRRAPSFA